MWTLSFSLLFQIVFYEERNFQGRHYECSSNECPDMYTYFTRCNSIRVESGTWACYERPNFMGYMYVLTRGEYPDSSRWMGFNDCIRSCRSIRVARSGVHKMRAFERPEFGGQSVEFMDDCPNLQDCFPSREIQACSVTDGTWVFYEQPNYRGRQYLLERGEYRRYTDWGAPNPRVGSFRRVLED
eukprot:gi/632989268/ref/XP_007883557.1/ PREDICTED: beta-crystallin S-1-like [Callorhinchus milii]